ncbi:MAG: hypothetical protein Q9200_003866 [Gallowayella weberi]
MTSQAGPTQLETSSRHQQNIKLHSSSPAPAADGPSHKMLLNWTIVTLLLLLIAFMVFIVLDAGKRVTAVVGAGAPYRLHEDISDAGPPVPVLIPETTRSTFGMGRFHFWRWGRNRNTVGESVASNAVTNQTTATPSEADHLNAQSHPIELVPTSARSARSVDWDAASSTLTASSADITHARTLRDVN